MSDRTVDLPPRFTRIVDASDHWKRRGRMVRRARIARWPEVQDFARATGLSPSTIDIIEKGRRATFREATVAAIEAAIDWEPGSFERVGQGGQPRVRDDREMARLRIAWPSLSIDARRILATLAETAVQER